MCCTQTKLPGRAYTKGGRWLAFSTQLDKDRKQHSLTYSAEGGESNTLTFFVSTAPTLGRYREHLPRDTAAGHPCRIPLETRHGTREKHIIRGVHLREPARSFVFLARDYQKKTVTSVFFFYWFFSSLATFFFFFDSVYRLWTPRQWTPLLQRSGSGSRRGDGGLVRMFSSLHIIFFPILLWRWSPVNGKQSFTQSFTHVLPVRGDGTSGRPDGTG